MLAYREKREKRMNGQLSEDSFDSPKKRGKAFFGKGKQNGERVASQDGGSPAVSDKSKKKFYNTSQISSVHEN